MSYVLHLWEHPVPASVSEADWSARTSAFGLLETVHSEKVDT